MEVSTEKPKIERKPKPSPGRVPFRDLFKPHETIPQRYYGAAVALSLIVIFGVWSLLSYGGFIKPAYFLPTPTLVLQTAGRMIQTGELAENAQASIVVIVVG